MEERGSLTKFLLGLLLNLLCTIGISQNTYLNPNVGIGITNPAPLLGKLHILETGSESTSIFIEGPALFALKLKSVGSASVHSTTHRLTQVYNNDAADRNGFIDFVRGGDNSGGGLGLGSNGMERLRIAGNGNVGIGTITPQHLLQVNGTGQFNLLYTPAIAGSISALNDVFTYDSQEMYHYGLKWTNDTWRLGAASTWLSGYGGIKIFTGGQPRLNINSIGNVGLGTTTPSTKLQIGNGGDGWENGLTIHSSYPTIYLRDSDSPQKSAMIHLNDNHLHFLGSSYSLPSAGNNWEQVNSGYWPLTLNLVNNDAVFGGNLTTSGSFYSNGTIIKVGKLTSSDTEQGLTSLQLEARGAGGSTKHWNLYTAPVGGGFGVEPNAFEVWQYPETKARFKILQNGNTYLVPTGGNVSIGNNTPLAKLDITTTAGNGNYFRVGNSNSAVLTIDSWGRTDFKRRVQIDGSDGVWASPSDVLFSLKPPLSQTGNIIEVNTTNGNSGNIFNIQANGNIGVGIINPSEKLMVNGNIVSKKVRVTQTGWADYVFEENYPLLPINELNRFVQVNKHLPDIPSEKEVVANGLDLGDMQALLLKKVEELTLYIINLQRQLDELKREQGANKH